LAILGSTSPRNQPVKIEYSYVIFLIQQPYERCTVIVIIVLCTEEFLRGKVMEGEKLKKRDREGAREG
jgi:hypothetical protein